MIPPRLTLSNIRYVSRVKWSNLGKGVVPSPTSQCSSYWKGSLQVALDYGHQLYLLLNYTTKCQNIIFGTVNMMIYPQKMLSLKLKNLFNTNVNKNVKKHKIWEPTVIFFFFNKGSAWVLTVIFIGNELSDLSSNPGRGCLHFTSANIFRKGMNLNVLPPVIGN